MPSSNTSLVHSYLYNPHSDPGELKTYSNSARSESEMRESGSQTNVPTMAYGTFTDGSDDIHLPSLLPQTEPQGCFAPTLSWSDLHPTAANDRSTYDYNNDQNFTSVPNEMSYEDVGHQKPTEHEPCLPDVERGPPQTTPNPPLPIDFSFPPAHAISHTAFMRRRSFLPLPTVANYRRTWDDSDFGNTMSEILAPQPHHFHAFAFDAADISGPSLYATASNHQSTVPSTSERMYQNADDTVSMGGYETDSESAKGEPPYAKLIYNALMDAPDRRLVLRDIYTWISDNTEKAKDPAFKGWQNSVRHNLSMNGAFVKVPHVDLANKHKKGFIWVLDPSAVDKGIESTTRYRQKTVSKRIHNSDLVDPKRQKSGRKGGRAARKSAKARRSAKVDNYESRYGHYLGSRTPGYCQSPAVTEGQSISPDLTHYNMGGLPYYLDPPSSESPHPENPPYSYPDIIARTGLSTDQSLFGNSFDSDSDFLCSRPEDLYGGQAMTAFV